MICVSDMASNTESVNYGMRSYYRQSRYRRWVSKEKEGEKINACVYNCRKPAPDFVVCHPRGLKNIVAQQVTYQLNRHRSPPFVVKDPIRNIGPTRILSSVIVEFFDSAFN